MTHVLQAPWRHRRRRARALARLVLLSLPLAGCANVYDLTLMPSDSGKLYYGSARETSRAQATVSIVIGDKTYNGTWLAVAPDYSGTYVGGTYGRGWRGGYGGDAMLVDQGSQDAVAKALLQAADGSGLRCDLFGLNGGQGAGKCVDDAGHVYDVQIRLRKIQ